MQYIYGFLVACRCNSLCFESLGFPQCYNLIHTWYHKLFVEQFSFVQHTYMNIHHKTWYECLPPLIVNAAYLVHKSCRYIQWDRCRRKRWHHLHMSLRSGMGCLHTHWYLKEWHHGLNIDICLFIMLFLSCITPSFCHRLLPHSLMSGILYSSNFHCLIVIIQSVNWPAAPHALRTLLPQSHTITYPS